MRHGPAFLHFLTVNEDKNKQIMVQCDKSVIVGSTEDYGRLDGDINSIRHPSGRGGNYGSEVG